MGFNWSSTVEVVEEGEIVWIFHVDWQKNWGVPSFLCALVRGVRIAGNKCDDNWKFDLSRVLCNKEKKDIAMTSSSSTNL